MKAKSIGAAFAAGTITLGAMAQEFEVGDLQVVAAPEIGVGRGVCAELDGQPGIDIVVPNNTSDNVAIVLNDGDGVPIALDTVDIGNAARAVCCCDWDRDGWMDVLAIDPSLDRLAYVRQVSDDDWDLVETIGLPWEPEDIACADVNDDGYCDVAITLPLGTQVRVLINDGDGTLAGSSATNYAAGVARLVEFADVDCDGDQDLITVSYDEFVTVRLNDGLGSFGAGTDYTTGNDPSDVEFVDVNGDGKPDMVIPNRIDGTVSIWINDGAGGFGSVTHVPCGTQPASVATGDIDCDGDADIAVLRLAGGSGGALAALINNDNASSWTIDAEVEFLTSAGVAWMTACQWDREPGLDLVTFEAQPLPAFRALTNIGAACDDCIEPAPNSVAWYAGDLCGPADLHGFFDASFTSFPFCPANWQVGGGAMAFSSSAPNYMTTDVDCGPDPLDHGYTISTWVRSTSPSNFQGLASKGVAPGFELLMINGHARFTICDGGSCWLTDGSTTINDGEWHHVAVTLLRGPTSIVTLWVDGHIEDVTLAPLGTIDTPHPLLIGASPSPSPSLFFDGEMDEFQIHDRALLVHEVQAIYHAGMAGQCRETCRVVDTCIEGFIEVHMGGVEDGFGGGTEPAFMSPELAVSCGGGQDFDEDPFAGSSMCHTFTALPDDIIAATLEFRAASNNTVPCNDTVQLQATATPGVFLWGRHLGAPEGSPSCEDNNPGLLPCEWDQNDERTFCLDLTALPLVDGSTINILDDVNATGRLDVRLQDDTAVDYMRLRIVRCPCESDISGDGVVDVSDLLALLGMWGACDDPCPPCAGDFNGDCVVDTSDMLELIGSYGPCAE